MSCVRATKGSERSRMGCNRSVVGVLRRRMVRVCHLTGSEAWHRESISEHKVFFNSRKGSHICRSGLIKARMESLKTLVE